MRHIGDSQCVASLHIGNCAILSQATFVVFEFSRDAKWVKRHAYFYSIIFNVPSTLTRHAGEKKYLLPEEWSA